MPLEHLRQRMLGTRLSKKDKEELSAIIQAIRTAFLVGSATYDTASLADGAGATGTLTVTGAALGDHVFGISMGVDVQGMTVTGYVSAANTVSFRIQNESGGIIDLASTTVRAVVAKRSAFDGIYLAGLRV